MRTLLLIVFLCGTTPTSPERAPERQAPTSLQAEPATGAPKEASAASRRALRELKEARQKLKRTQLDQSLIRAERTAHMLAEFEAYAPASVDPAQNGGRP